MTSGPPKVPDEGEVPVGGRIAQGDNPAEERHLDHKALNHQGALHALPQSIERRPCLGKGVGAP